MNVRELTDMVSNLKSVVQRILTENLDRKYENMQYENLLFTMARNQCRENVSIE